MDSRHKAESADVRERQLSRRSVLSGGSAAPFINQGHAPGNADPAVTLCTRWLAVDAEQRRLQLEWGMLEGWLMTKRSWYKLSPEQRAEIPEGARLAEIDSWLDVLEVEGHALLEAMRPKPAKSVEAVIANLSVAARLIFVEDHPEAHGLITRAVRDLAAFSGGK
ncbi:hypothetical protein [Caulobacter segnis]|uniref:hypothetical protein n=1 Tax=Caulobacter segnis TaxID=88688 RepID=UPI001CC10C16|nr:hypothetical protein [Caulobacter segnis]UAL11694.1 hypothetical protein K8940_05260 [Caulobacter segnis]